MMRVGIVVGGDQQDVLSIHEGYVDAVLEENSRHHQAIRDPGTLLGVTGWSKDGTAEAVEAVNMLGVQWHPELLFRSDRRHLRPFLWLVGGDSALAGN